MLWSGLISTSFRGSVVGIRGQVDPDTPVETDTVLQGQLTPKCSHALFLRRRKKIDSKIKQKDTESKGDRKNLAWVTHDVINPKEQSVCTYLDVHDCTWTHSSAVALGNTWVGFLYIIFTPLSRISFSLKFFSVVYGSPFQQFDQLLPPRTIVSDFKYVNYRDLSTELVSVNSASTCNDTNPQESNRIKQ